ncbi:hypothetical protein [Sporocytophaga myxococcoides]|uniref:hypothetical protein n=1 Tax=Sporocytophaga myxococcoides TaxID=153721 RepID=UPI0003F85796|nr:hypothetical protein [Sporocytophaga myxococcoides]
MTKYLLGLWTLFLMSCGSGIPSDYATRSTVDPSELKFKKGDCLEFKIDSLTYGVGVVFDFSKDESGIWYGLLLTNYESRNKPTIDSILNRRFLGRKIQSSLNDKGFEIGIDAEYILDSLLTDNFSLVGNLSLNDKVKLGSEGASSDMEGLIQKLKNGKERRLSPPDDYREHLTKSDNFRPDEYFDVKDFVEK